MRLIPHDCFYANLYDDSLSFNKEYMYFGNLTRFKYSLNWNDPNKL